MMKLMLLTADPIFAAEAQGAGVDRIFLDLEILNKAERQSGRNTLLSYNRIEDVAVLRTVLNRSELLVRTNPIHPGLPAEMEQILDGGPDILMLPMVTGKADAERFVQAIGGRARVCLLLETPQALVRLDEILQVPGVDEIYIGLNDMHIGMALTFMFELLSGGIVDFMAQKISARGLPFGFGGMAKIGEGILPAENILGEHYRLGSSSVILSRTFRNEVGPAQTPVALNYEVSRIREQERRVSAWGNEEFARNREFVQEKVAEVLQHIMKTKREN